MKGDIHSFKFLSEVDQKQFSNLRLNFENDGTNFSRALAKTLRDKPEISERFNVRCHTNNISDKSYQHRGEYLFETMVVLTNKTNSDVHKSVLSLAEKTSRDYINQHHFLESQPGREGVVGRFYSSPADNDKVIREALSSGLFQKKSDKKVDTQVDKYIDHGGRTPRRSGSSPSS